MRRRDRTRGRQGDHLVTCERSGFTVWASEARKEWTGAIVYKDFYEPRHHQDFVRARRDNSAVRDARPPPTPVFVGPLMTETTANAAAGATTISVLHTERMAPGDGIGIYLDSGDLHRNTIFDVTGLTTLVLTSGLPGAVASGANVIDFSAVALGDLG